MLENMITDRTQADIETVKGLTEAIKMGTATEDQVLAYVNAIQKGAYTHEDLNRVEAAVRYVATRLWDYGYISPLPVIQFWSVDDKPNQDDFRRYLGNIALIRSAIPLGDNTPEAPNDMNGFDISKANALEQILLDVNLIINKIQAAWFYAGDLYSAEV